MAAITICSDFEAPKNKVWHCFYCFLIYLPWSDGTRCHDLSFWILSFKPTFSVSSFTFIKRLFSSSSLSAIRVMSSAYLRLLIFLLAILIPACATFSPAFLMMYSAFKLNEQGDNIQPWHTPFPIWNQSVVPCPFLTVASWPAYRCLKRQVRWSGMPISLRIFYSLLWSTQSKCVDHNQLWKMRWLEPIYLNIIVNILFLWILVSSLPLFPLKVKRKERDYGIFFIKKLYPSVFQLLLGSLF